MKFNKIYVRSRPSHNYCNTQYQLEMKKFEILLDCWVFVKKSTTELYCHADAKDCARSADITVRVHFRRALGNCTFVHF